MLDLAESGQRRSLFRLDRIAVPGKEVAFAWRKWEKSHDSSGSAITMTDSRFGGFATEAPDFGDVSG
jgi:hypothetical protein